MFAVRAKKIGESRNFPQFSCAIWWFRSRWRRIPVGLAEPDPRSAHIYIGNRAAVADKDFAASTADRGFAASKAEVDKDFVASTVAACTGCSSRSFRRGLVLDQETVVGHRRRRSA